jgi:hypothetical protein
MSNHANNLSPAMQARLDNWMKKPEQLPLPQKRGFVSKGDYLDSIQDIEDRDAKSWKEHLQKNPEFRR